MEKNMFVFSVSRQQDAMDVPEAAECAGKTADVAKAQDELTGGTDRSCEDLRQQSEDRRYRPGDHRGIIYNTDQCKFQRRDDSCDDRACGRGKKQNRTGMRNLCGKMWQYRQL